MKIKPINLPTNYLLFSNGLRTPIFIAICFQLDKLSHCYRNRYMKACVEPCGTGAECSSIIQYLLPPPEYPLSLTFC